MRYGSVCSGVEAATLAWHNLGWEPQWFSEIEKFPSAVLAHRWPSVPNLGDMTKLHETKEFHDRSIDLLVGGTPCQSFSIAGLRKGMDDPRGNLALTFLGIASKSRPRWIVWENVPGVLSSNRGRDFGTFISALGQLGYGWAYRVLDAQYFGVPQRRRRVFVVGYLGDWRYPAAVLFERKSLSGDPAPSREEGQETSPTIRRRIDGLRGDGQDAIVPSLLTMRDGKPGGGKGPLISEDKSLSLGTGNNQILFDPNQITSKTNRSNPLPGAPCRALPATPNSPMVFDMRGNGDGNTCPTLTKEAGGDRPSDYAAMDHGSMGVRRLTPRECERLQGFPDDYTCVPFRGKPACDGPRYKAIGNSMAVPVMRWLGERINMVEGMIER